MTATQGHGDEDTVIDRWSWPGSRFEVIAILQNSLETFVLGQTEFSHTSFGGCFPLPGAFGFPINGDIH